jgi:hypothetical protein
MIKPEQGPGDMGVLAKQVPKASITALRGLICCGCNKCLSKAIAAALNAWPGVHTGPNIYGRQDAVMHLPLTAGEADDNV